MPGARDATHKFQQAHTVDIMGGLLPETTNVPWLRQTYATFALCAGDCPHDEQVTSENPG